MRKRQQIQITAPKYMKVFRTNRLFAQMREQGESLKED